MTIDILRGRKLGADISAKSLPVLRIGKYKVQSKCQPNRRGVGSTATKNEHNTKEILTAVSVN